MTGVRARGASGMLRDVGVCRGVLVVVGLAVVLLGVGVSAAWGSVGWGVHAVPEPTSFRSSDALACAEAIEPKCDRYQLLLLNTGDQASTGPVTVRDTLPAGLVYTEFFSGHHENGVEWECPSSPGEATVTCTYEPSVGAGRYTPYLQIDVSAPTTAMEAAKAPLVNRVAVEGGGAAPATTLGESALAGPEGFEVSEFSFALQLAGGAPAIAAGGHPWQLTTTFRIPSHQTPAGAGYAFEPVKDFKSVAVELPAGVVGNPLATEHCTETQLREGHCPSGSAVGVFALQSGSNGGADSGSFFEATGEEKSFNKTCCSRVYNMVPDAGFPAEFGFDYGETIPIVFYANVVHTGTGYRVRVTVPGVGVTKALSGSTVTFFGEPGAQTLDEGVEGEPIVAPSETAFLSDPSDCSAEAEGLSGESRVPLAGGLPVTAREFSSRLELEPWSEPGPEHVIHGEDQAFSSLSGCGALAGLFKPTLEMAPSATGGEATEEGSTVADEPSAYSVNLRLPQTTSFHEAATPDLRQATVTLPDGVSVSPSAANGIVGCQETGSEGINLGSSDIGPGGQDLGDPDATELGAGSGRAGGNGSPYDDGFYHTAPGHCPKESIVATAEVCTPLLANRANSAGEVKEGVKACEEGTGTGPLQGNVYLAEPKCGGAGQSECTPASATNGELFGIYLELSGDGVIVKLPGKVEANPTTGQLTGTFAENPQLPFSDLKLHFKGGARASLANPQTCGRFTTTSSLRSWAAEASTPPVIDSNSFEIGGCPTGATPFAPSFLAGTLDTVAGANSPFVLSFSRGDREQDLSGVTVNMPQGLVGQIAGIPLCGEAQANAGSCPAASQIGEATATAGPGPEPFQETGGRVYLTGGYKGGPFGLSVVVPTKAGPFNLGDEVVRASIHINPSTSAVTVVSDPLPQIKDGVPFRLRSVSVDIDRPEFIRNPTSCVQQPVTALLTGAQGAQASVSTPFAASGCAGLPFKPSYSYYTQARTSKANGASLIVKVAQKPGEANIHKVDLTIPQIMPSRLTTIQKACLAATFEADPAGCPEGSDIGTATAHTPLLNAPLTGPAYLVSHGGAAFPDVEFVLQGEGVTVILDGKTDIKKGITYSRFETVPDAPITSFETILPEGPHSALTTERPGVTNLCGTHKTVTIKRKVTRRVGGKTKHVTVTSKRTVTKPLALTIPTVITGQNGAVITQNTKVAVTGCPKPKPQAVKSKTATSHHRAKK